MQRITQAGRRPLVIAACLVALVGITLLLVSSADDPTVPIAVAGVAAFALKDADPAVVKTKALPNGATTITTDGIDLGHTAKGSFLANAELLVEAPALTTGELPDAQTITYSVEHDDDPAFGTVATLFASTTVQTGAGGAGAAAVTTRHRFPSNVKQHVRVKAVKTGASDASTKSVTARLVF